MQITLDLPEDIAGELGIGGCDLSRAALEGLALEGFASGDCRNHKSGGS